MSKRSSSTDVLETPLLGDGARPSPFGIVTGLLATALAIALAWGLSHVSEHPSVLGRYSAGYAAVLLVLALVLAVLVASLVKPVPWLREWLTNGYLLFFSCALAFTALEAGLRMLNPWGVDFFHQLPFHMQGMVTHPQLVYAHPRSVEYRLGANRVALDSHGLRGGELPLAKPSGERRILALGDSVTFGWGVSQGETFADVLEQTLASHPGTRWRVLNAGVNGYNTRQAVDYFELAGQAFAPDIVVLTWVDNDVDDAFRPNLATWRRYPTWPDNLPEALSRLRQLSYTFQLSKLLLTAQAAEKARHAPGSALASVTLHPGWVAARSALARLRDACRAQGVRLLFAVASGAEPRLLEAVRSLGIETVTLQGAWDAVPLADRFVSRIDSHPSAQVHAEMARLLHQELQRRGWLERQ